MKITRRQLREMIQGQLSEDPMPAGKTTVITGDEGRVDRPVAKPIKMKTDYSELLEYIFTEVLTIRQQKKIMNKMLKDLESVGLPPGGGDFLRDLMMSAIKSQRREKWRELFRLGKD
jgi:hypothetical protein